MKEHFFIFPALIFLLVFHGKITPWDEPSPPKLFTQLPSSQTGIDFNNQIIDAEGANILLYDNFYGGAGVAVGDFNNDGFQDVYFAGNLVADKLYINEGDFRFKDVSDSAGLVNDGGWTTGVTVADVNNDGYVDIYLSRELYDHRPDLRKNLLYINNGDLTFTESAEKYGVADTQRTRHASFLDYDKDGNLDLFLLTQPPNPGSYSEYFGAPLLQPEYHLKLYKNTGKGNFVEVSQQAGVDRTGFPNAVSTSDFNNDGWTDIYVANDFNAPDFLFLNDQKGGFVNVVDEAFNHMSFYSMGVDVSDINNDGLLDIFVVDMAAEDNFRLKANMSGMNPEAFWKVVNNGGHYQYMYNTFQLDNGNGTYSDVAQMTDMASTDWSWSNLVADFDNDGLKDTYVTNGLLRDIRNTDSDKKLGQYVIDISQKWVKENPNGGEISIWEILDLDHAVSLIPSQPIKNYAYKNFGDLKFKKMASEWGLDQESFSNGAAYADFDNDGDLDLVVNNINAEAFVYKNNSESLPGSNYLRIKLSSTFHSPVLGTRVELYSNGKMQLNETTNVRGIYSTSEQTVHFGLGNTSNVDSLVVLWPNFKKTVLRDVQSNREIELNMEEAKTEYDPKTDTFKSGYFTHIDSKLPINHNHVENDFDDFSSQVLLPHQMSKFGPALAKGDVNGDGLEDVFVGGATGYPASLFVQQTNGSFEKSGEALWEKEKPYEDIDAIFVDINGDGFQDLYVVSGGNEFPVNDFHYVDRLYMNDGTGNFSKSAIPNVGRDSGSSVRAADYDNDGDIDLFVGGRLWPHQYPMPASSMLLKNENGQLKNVTKELAPELENLGMVTDAVWNDFDGDGDLDLTVVGEWMPITVFKNENGRLNKMAPNGLSEASGWWFSIEKGDFDNDGDMDYIAGNLGLNYKYKTSPEKPFDIYYNDFDTNGHYDIVLGYYNNDKHYPLRGFSCSSEQVPMLKDKFKKYDVFATLELDEVYGGENLDESLHYLANTFASSYVENLGNGDFKIHELPRMTQLSSINDIMVKDFNKDGHLDALVVGNLFVSEIETPRNDAGTGTLLLGDGKGSFEAIVSAQSGFFDNQDAKKMISITVKGSEYVMVADNNGPLQFFKVN